MFAVVGGGITGAFAAYFLARRGVEVTLIERDEVAAHASGSNPGGLNPLHGPGIPGPMEELAMAAFRLHLEHFSPPRRPRLQLALDDADVERLERGKELYDAAPGLSARWLDREELTELEPGLDPAVRRGLLTEGNGKVAAAEYTRAVVDAAAPALLRAEATGIEPGPELVLGDHTLACDGVVVASGAWCAWLGEPLPVEPAVGEMLLLERHGGARIDLAWRESGVYAAGEEEVWVGGPPRLASRVLPDLREARELRRTSAPRPATPDGFPIIGPLPGHRNVCLALGGGRKGMLLGPALGLATAEILTEGRTRLPIDHCAPERCSGLSASAA